MVAGACHLVSLARFPSYESGCNDNSRTQHCNHSPNASSSPLNPLRKLGILTFNRHNIILELLLTQIFPLEPIRNDLTSTTLASRISALPQQAGHSHQLPARPQQLKHIPKEQLLVGKMRQRLGNPHAIKPLPRRALAHLFRIQLEERNLALAEREGRLAGLPRSRQLSRDLGRHLDLPPGDGDARHGTAVFARQMARRAADAAADVEDAAVAGKRGLREEELDELDLRLLFAVRGREEVAVMDVLAPGIGCLAFREAGNWGGTYWKDEGIEWGKGGQVYQSE